MATKMFANTERFDPYRTFKFQVLIDGVSVAGLRKMTALKRTTEVARWRTAGDTHERKLPGGTSYDSITLEQGLTHDQVFFNWANLVNNIGGDGGVSLKNYRKEIVVNLLNLQGVPAISYKIKRAWVSEFTALPDLDAGSTTTVGIQTLKIEHEGFEMDEAVTEPTET